MIRVDVYHGDSREILKVMADASVDAVVTDPPYALVSIGKRFGAEGAAPAKAQDGAAGAYSRASAGFMGQRWDTGETAFAVEFWAEVYRVLKPGGHVIAFAATRTYHRLACAVEDGGFEIRDMVAWLYGSGFPKSHDVAKGLDKAELNIIRGRAGRSGESFGQEYERTPKGAPIGDNAKLWEGWGTALKPALEPCVLARKPLDGTVVANVLRHGTGALNIGACRIGTEARANGAASTSSLQRASRAEAGYREDDGVGPGAEGGEVVGRWPANVVHDGADEVVDAFPHAGPGSARVRNNGAFDSVAKGHDNPHQTFGHDDEGGSAARFFYSAKADAMDRMGSGHPTVKPVDLMAWLVRLVTPPGGVVLDPFGGSGSTGVACLREGFDAILIEREARHCDDIRRRIAWARGEGGLTRQEVLKRKLDKAPGAARGEGLPLFGGETQDAQGGGIASSTASSPGTDDRPHGAQAVRAAE